MKSKILALVLIVGSLGVGLAVAQSDQSPAWPQWGQNSQHDSFVSTVAQDVNSVLADVVYDPFTAAEARDTGGSLLVHYQVAILAGNDVFMEFKSGRFIECNPPGSGIPPAGEAECGIAAWNSQTWNEKRLHWENGALVEKWTFQSDWKAVRIELAQWEPVFHAVLANDIVYVPGLGGTVFKVDRGDGSNLGRINPFGTIDPETSTTTQLSSRTRPQVFFLA